MDASASDDFLDRAARLRATGSSWDHTADELGLDPDELQQMARDAGADFHKLLAAARQEVVTEGFAEAVFSLRRLLRAKSEAVCGKAADFLARIWMTTRRHRRRAATLTRAERQAADAAAQAPRLLAGRRRGEVKVVVADRGYDADAILPLVGRLRAVIPPVSRRTHPRRYSRRPYVGARVVRHHPDEAGRRRRRLGRHDTPGHARRLDMAGCESGVRAGRCRDRGGDGREKLGAAVAAREGVRNEAGAEIDWTFRVADAGKKLVLLDPKELVRQITTAGAASLYFAARQVVGRAWRSGKPASGKPRSFSSS